MVNGTWPPYGRSKQEHVEMEYAPDEVPPRPRSNDPYAWPSELKDAWDRATAERQRLADQYLKWKIRPMEGECSEDER